jgi:hypothetical protein
VKQGTVLFLRRDSLQTSCLEISYDSAAAGSSEIPGTASAGRLTDHPRSRIRSQLSGFVYRWLQNRDWFPMHAHVSLQIQQQQGCLYRFLNVLDLEAVLKK